MRTEHRQDGVTTYVYNNDDPPSATVLDIRNAVERIDAMCRDILTTLNLLVDLLPEAHNGVPVHGDEGQDGSDTVD